MAAAERDVLAGADRSKAAALNRALRQLYPKDVLAPASHVVAVLDDDQARMRRTTGYTMSFRFICILHSFITAGSRSSMLVAV